MRFLQALDTGRVLLMDGAMGTELLRAGLPRGEPGEAWVLKRPGLVRQVHSASVEAGAEVLLTCSFLANPGALARHGLADRLEEINAAAVRLARSASKQGAPDREVFVVGDVGPLLDATGREVVPPADLRRTLTSLEGADAILFETWSSPAALEAAAFALHRVPEVEDHPLLLSLTYHRDPSGRLVTRSGHGPETYARHALQHGLAALGVNCGKDIDMDDMVEVLHRYRDHTDLPLFARPNAGIPVKEGQGWRYPRSPQGMAARVPDLVAAGAVMVGGCCGTTPAHIAAFRRALDGIA